jgi:cell division septation protein DedD
MDKSGQYVILESTAADRPAHAPLYVWDTNSNHITALPQSALPGGHYATGYGMLVNQDCCTSTSWDAAQWQLRSLANPTSTQDLINPVVTPQEVNASDHSSWNNAQPGALVPFISGFFRSSSDTSNWRPWDGEIVAVQTGGGGTTVWRFAHHRSNVSSFWDMPRPNVSQDGRWAIFTSNWEGAVGSGRDDVFMVSLGGLGGSASPAPTPVTPTPSPAPAPAPAPAPTPTPTPAPAPTPAPTPAPQPSNPPTTSTSAGIQWSLLSNAVAAGNGIQKTGGCDGCPDAGGMSTQQLTADGAVQFTASETDTLRFLGLTSASATVDPSAFAFAIRLQGGVAEVREYGAYKTETTFATGDVFRIVVVGGGVTYQKNGATFYTSGGSAAFPLTVNASLFSMNATLTGITIATASQGTVGAASTAPPTVTTTTTTTAASWMIPAQMAPGASVWSNNGQYWLVYQTDGNLVLYNVNRTPLWSSGTAGTSPGHVNMQNDGNLVIYDGSGAPVWSSGTWGNSAARAVVQDDGNFVVYDAGWQPLWNRLTQ